MATASSRQFKRSALTVAKVLKANTSDWLRCHAQPPQVRSTLNKIGLCRTEALGGHEYHCQQCDKNVIVANSCGDRHCPTCRGARRRDWLERVSQRLLDGIDHYQVVFTLPEQLRALVLGNRRELFNLLFRAANQALAGSLRHEHQMQSASLTVLHTWNQKLEFHPHVHCIVPGSGLSVDGERVVHTRLPGAVPHLVDHADLKQRFRECFLHGLQQLRAKEQLQFAGSTLPLADAESWQHFMNKLTRIEWVAHITAPPGKAESDTILKYLARYISGGPISDSRLVSTDDHRVTFMARSGQVSGGVREKVPVTLSQLEFVRRWCLHVLPSQFTRVRYYGQWSPRNIEPYLERLAIQLDSDTDTNAPLADDATVFDVGELNAPEGYMAASAAEPEVPCCPNCKSQLILHRVHARPPWSHLLATPPPD